ncbi:MAG: nucleotidyltransferase domain-containing protein [Candidatus Saganbacteria bacterium]|nr:nucleotidyltransferase domain-containing protein [Candidatus Saganbacteria bacterium]
MLELFTKSKIRQKIILLFIYNQNKQFYLSEIAERVGTSPGTAQRELNKLLKNDLILFAKKSGLSTYTLNKRYSLLTEVESIIKKTVGIEEELRNELGKIKNLSFAFLFGSYVKGGFKSDSDIDLFVIGKMDEDKVFRAVRETEKNIGRTINYHLADMAGFFEQVRANPFYRDILKNYTLLIGDKNEFKKLIK